MVTVTGTVGGEKTVIAAIVGSEVIDTPGFLEATQVLQHPAAPVAPAFAVLLVG